MWNVFFLIWLVISKINWFKCSRQVFSLNDEASESHSHQQSIKPISSILFGKGMRFPNGKRKLNIYRTDSEKFFLNCLFPNVESMTSFQTCFIRIADGKRQWCRVSSANDNWIFSPHGPKGQVSHLSHKAVIRKIMNWLSFTNLTTEKNQFI